MTPQRWQRVHELFEAAGQLAPDGREAFLSTQCEQDAGLRREVESLLTFDAQDTPTLRDLTLPSAAALSDAALERAEEAVENLAAKRRLGAYELLGPLASGGMSMVWLAQRADDQFKQRVAVKVIKRGLDGPDVLQRFRNERQLLANLSHPNIARLLDGGVTDDGLPFLVMEYVDGQPIDKYCDSRRMPVSERIELLRTVCAAVAYAHQNLVVHRDLKPANILVTQRGVPILLDFGIAKVLNPAGIPGFDTVTGNGERPMTPAYASPEQIRGRPITTASDIYSLGVVLYELLSGHRPYETPDGLPVDIEHAACETAPPRPSTVVARDALRPGVNGDPALRTEAREIAGRRASDCPRLRQRLAGDLDTIVLKAMDKDAARRYASVEQFAEDLRWHLDGLPVRARPATLRYRAAKFAVRNRWPLTFATIVIIVVATLIGLLWQQSVVASRERDAALASELRAGKAETKALAEAGKERQTATSARNAIRFLMSVMAADARKRGSESWPELRRRCDELVDTLNEAPPADAPLEAEARLALGRQYADIFANSHAERELLRVVELRRIIPDELPTEYATAVFELGVVRERIGDLSGSELAIRNALDIRRSAHGSRYHPEAVAAAIALGELLVELGRYAESQEGGLFAEPAEFSRFTPVAAIRGRLNRANAVSHANAALALNLIEGLLSELPPEAPPAELGWIRACWAACQRRRGDLPRAAQICDEALARLSAGSPPDLRRIAEATIIRADIALDAGEIAAARASYFDALDRLKQLEMGKHTLAARAHKGLAEAAWRNAEWAAAEKHLHEALALRIAAGGARSVLAADSCYDLGDLFLAQGRLDDAETMLLRALDVRRHEMIVFSEREVAVAATLDLLAQVFERRGDRAKAVETLRELLDRLEYADDAFGTKTLAVRARLEAIESPGSPRPDTP